MFSKNKTTKSTETYSQKIDDNKNATFVSLNIGETAIAKEVTRQSISIEEDIGKVLSSLLK